MHYKIRRFFWLAPLLLVFLTSNATLGLSSFDSVGNVIVKSQPVFVLRDGSTLNVGSFGRKLENGDIIVTGKTGKAQIIMADKSEIIIAPLAKFTIFEKTTKGALTKSKSQLFSFEGKIRAKIRKSGSRIRFKSVNAEINIKGTEFVAENVSNTTTVATLEGVVNLSSVKTGTSIDIPPGKMSSVSAAGEVMPLSEIAGEILKGVESAGEKMKEEDIAGKKI